MISGTKHIFVGIYDSTGFTKITHASQYNTDRTELRKKKICEIIFWSRCIIQSYVTLRIRRAPTRHDNIDFRPIITRTSDILPLSVVTADKGYDSEDNHLLVREVLTCIQCNPSSI